MNSYAPSQFRPLDKEDERRAFEKAAEQDFEAAEDEITVKSIFHPVYRLRLAELLAERAKTDLDRMDQHYG